MVNLPQAGIYLDHATVLLILKKDVVFLFYFKGFGSQAHAIIETDVRSLWAALSGSELTGPDPEPPGKFESGRLFPTEAVDGPARKL